MENLRVLELIRVSYRQDATFGVLIDHGMDEELDSAGEPFAVTCEEAWRDNKPNISCIPEGEYTCIKWQSPKFGWTYQVTGVPGRSLILFHKGNTTEDTEGCVLVAESFERFGKAVGVAQSAKGFEEFLRRLGDVSKFRLLVTEA